ncbi:hypothetical protein PRIC1_007882 [Phytophthora ramorum]
MSVSCSRGDHLLLLPEDVSGLMEPVYAKVTRVSGSSVSIVDVVNSKRKWKVPTEVAVARHVTEAVAMGPQPGLWLRHGVVVQLADTGEVRVRIPDAIQVDPIIALLLWDYKAPLEGVVEALEERHSTILDRLLGSPSQRSRRSSRDPLVLLHGIVPAADIPEGSTNRSWTDPQDGSERVFPLQHAIDYVYITDSAARRVPKSVRDAVGDLFCRPPISTRSVAATATPPVQQRNAKRSLPSEASFFNAASPAPSLEAAPDLNARIMGKLTDDPVLLAHFLLVVVLSPQPPAPSSRLPTQSAIV